MKISARKKDWPADKTSIEVEYDMPADLAGLQKKFGDDVVYNKCVDSVTIDIQAKMRRALEAKNEADRTPEAIQAAVTAYVPSATDRVRRSPAEKVEDLAGKMTAEEKKALIAKLREDLKAAA